MRQLKLLPLIIVSITLSCCAGHKGPQQTLNGSSALSAGSTAVTKTDSGAPANINSSQQAVIVTPQPMMDTGKIKPALNEVNDLLKGRLDTNKFNAVSAKVLSADAAMLSDSGIANMGGNSNGPSIIAAKKTLLNMRNSIGITPAILDSMKKSAAMLTKETN